MSKSSARDLTTYSLEDRASWQAAFAEDGVVRLRGIYDASELVALEAFFEAYLENEAGALQPTGAAPKGVWKGSTLAEVDRTKSQVRALHPHRSHFETIRPWYLHPRVATVLEGLFGKPALAAQTMYYYKPPGSRGQAMHQDNFYLLAAPATCIGVWTPIDDATEENGCLWMALGSHHEGIFCPESETAEGWMEYGDSHIRPFPRRHTPRPVPVRRGETLFFHGMLIHGSGPNRSPTRWRRTFIGHYVDEATEQLSHFYHPVLNMRGEVVSSVSAETGGGPCGDDWQGRVH